MIYFMQPADGGAVKIGHSSNLDARQTHLSWAYGRQMVVLATMPSGREEEAVIHEKFAHLRLGRTEQFRPTSELMDFIGKPSLVGANPDTIEALADHSQVSVITLKGSAEFRHWLAGESKRTHIPAATIVRLALAGWAEKSGARKPPEK